MLFKSITPIAVRLPLATPIKMSGVTIATADNLLVRIEDDTGAVGWGESTAAPTMTGETTAGMMAAVNYMAPQLLGMPFDDVAALNARLDALMYGNTAAKSAIETATHDLLGKRLGVPVHELLGGRRRDRATVLWMLAAGDLERDVSEASRKHDDGFASFKVKVGADAGGVPADVARVQRVRAAVGREVQISADANQGYTREQGIDFARRVDSETLDFFEQPVSGRDLAAMQAIARAGTVPLGADEGIHNLDDIERHAATGAAQGLSLKPIKLGGLQAVMTAAARADALGLKLNLAGKVADSSIASAAIAHLAVALPQLDWAVSITSQYLAQDLVRAPLRVHAGQVAPADAPGLGVEVDEDRVARFAYRP